MIVLMKYTVRQLLRKVKSCFLMGMWCNGSTLHLGCRGEVRVLHFQLTLLRLAARTRDFHSLNMGSIPVGVTFQMCDIIADKA